MITPIEFRRELHSNPELSFQEFETAKYIEEALDELKIEHRRIAKTGILAKIEGHGDLTNAVVLRADIDALPITEQTGLEYCSKNSGVMHACGHDIHAAVLFGVLQTVVGQSDFEGTLFAIFQPGEECNPGGASLVLAEKPFEGYNVKAIIGEHAEPLLDVGTLGFRSGQYMAASDELRFTVNGVGGHGAMRQQVKDPVLAATEFASRLIGLNREDCVLSIGKIIAEGATNVIPDSVYMEGTLRTFDEQERKIIKGRIQYIATEISQRVGTTIDINISKGYPSVVNNEVLTSIAVDLAKRGEHNIKMLPLRTTAEDFGFYGLQFPALFYRLGVGCDRGNPHTSTYNPDEGAIEVGVEFMRTLALHILGK